MNPLTVLIVLAQMYRKARNELGDYSTNIQEGIEKEVSRFFQDNYLYIAELDEVPPERGD